MTHNDLGACELFISELRRSGLVERGQLDPLLEEFIRFQPQADANMLAEHLISIGTLTPFQAERVRTGKTQGLVLGPYVLTNAIGTGSMGTVHQAVSKTDHKTYAVKVLPRRSMWNVRLARRQVRAFGQFQHPTVVPFVDVGTAGGLHYLVWPFVEGEPLEAMVQKNGKLDPAMTAYIAQQVALGLTQAQAAGLFHGLLKPSNVMVGAGGQVRILDFGIGSLLAENEGESLVDTMSTANTLTSGLDCASPESIMEPTNRTPAGDQYSLGCLMYFCLSGRYPFSEGSAVEKMMAHQFKQPTPITELAPETRAELAVIIDRLMQKKPEDRYSNLHEMLEAIAPLVGAHAKETLFPEPLRDSSQAGAGVVPPQPGSNHGRARFLKLSSQAPRPAVEGAPPVLPNRSFGSHHAVRGMPLPGSSPAAALPGSKLPVRSAAMDARSSPILPPVAPQLNLPTRQSMRVDAMPPVAPVQQHSDPRAQEPVVEPSDPPPILGPIGMLALGATVAISCFMLVQQILK